MARELPPPAEHALRAGDVHKAVALTVIDELGRLASDLTVLAGLAETPAEKSAYGLARRLLVNRALEYRREV